MTQPNPYVVPCKKCGNRTSLAYAEKHEGRCKPCTLGKPRRARPNIYDQPEAEVQRLVDLGMGEAEARNHVQDALHACVAHMRELIAKVLMDRGYTEADAKHFVAAALADIVAERASPTNPDRN